MAENDQVTLNGTLTEEIARSYITDKNDKLHQTSFKYGSITTILAGPVNSREDTTLKIQEEDGDEYNFKGAKAYDAVKYGRLLKYLEVHFFAEKDTKEVAAIFMRYTSGWTLLRADGNLCKLKLTQYSTRLMLVTELKSVWAGDLGTMDASDVCVQSSYLALAGANYQARSIFERALLFSGVMGTVLGPAQAVTLDALGAKDALSICM